MRRAPERLTEPVKLDGRTRTARAALAFKGELVQHVGGTPSAVQSAVIEQAVQIKLRLMLMDGAFAERGAQSAHDARQYLAWANSLSRLMRQLGPAAKPKVPTLAEHLAQRRPAA